MAEVDSFIVDYFFLDIIKTIPVKNLGSGMFEIEGSPDGGAATRALYMFVAQACGLGCFFLNWFGKSPVADGRDAEIA